MNRKIKFTGIHGTVAVAALVVMFGILTGCATVGEKPKPAMVPTERGTVASSSHSSGSSSSSSRCDMAGMGRGSSSSVLRNICARSRRNPG